MNSTNLFSPESAAAGQKNQGRARVKIAVFSVLAVHVAGLMALLLTQGCRRETAPENVPQPDAPAADTNTVSLLDTNLPPAMSTNLPPFGEVISNTIPQMEIPPATSAATKYTIKKGDSFYTIAKAHGVTQKAVEAANPGVDPKRLQLGQEINLPAPSSTPVAPALAVDVAAPTTYKVVSGDNLTKIANKFGTTPKAIKSLNGLTTDQIKVNQVLKIPQKPAPAPVPETPVVTPFTPAPATAPAPAPAQ